MKYKIYSIIVTYNAMKWIDKCLGSIKTSTLEVHPVIIDNCSKDDTVNYISKNYPNVHLIINKKNKGFGQANNQGIEYAYKQGATHFFLLNQDAWIYDDTIEKLIEVQDRNNLSIVSPVHLNGIGNLLDYSYFSYSVLNESNIEYVSDLIRKKIKSYYVVSNINAAAWMLTKKTIENIGGFDPIFFHYGEDDNYCDRVRYHNGNIAFIPDSFIHHDRYKKGNMKVYKKNSIVASLLREYSNINQSVFYISKLRIKMHLYNFIVLLSSLLKFKFKESSVMIRSYIVFVFKFPNIIKSIKANRKLKSNWLEL